MGIIGNLRHMGSCSGLDGAGPKWASTNWNPFHKTNGFSTGSDPGRTFSFGFGLSEPVPRFWVGYRVGLSYPIT